MLTDSRPRCKRYVSSVRVFVRARVGIKQHGVGRIKCLCKPSGSIEFKFEMLRSSLCYSQSLSVTVFCYLYTIVTRPLPHSTNTCTPVFTRYLCPIHVFRSPLLQWLSLHTSPHHRFAPVHRTATHLHLREERTIMTATFRVELNLTQPPESAFLAARYLRMLIIGFCVHKTSPTHS